MKSISVKCEACGAEFQLPATMAGLEVSCSCGRSLKVPKAEPQAAAGPAGAAATAKTAAAKTPGAAAASAPAKKAPAKAGGKVPEKGWYFSHSGLRFGPIGLDDLRKRLQTGELERSTKVFYSGLKEWVPSTKVFALWRPPAADMPKDKWHVSVGGKTYGPYSTARMWDILEQGKVKQTTMVWSGSMDGWKPAGEVPCLAMAWTAEVPAAQQAAQQKAAPAAQQAAQQEAAPAAQAPAQQKAEQQAAQAAEAETVVIEREEEQPKEEAKEEPAVQEPEEPAAGKEARQKAEEAFNAERYVEARQLYREAKEAGARLSEERLAEVEQKVKDLYEQAESMLGELESQSAAWKFEQAAQTHAALAETQTYQRNEGIRQRADELKAGLDAAREEAERQKAEADGQLLAAEEALSAWDIPAASEALVKLQQIKAVKWDEGLGEKVGDLRAKTAKAEQDLRGQRQAVEELVQSVKTKIPAWDFDAARRELEEAEQKAICKVDGELRRQTAELRVQFETTEKRITEQRQRATALLEDGEQKLAAWETLGAFQVLGELGDIEVCSRDEELKAGVADLEGRAESAEKELTAQRQIVTELVEDARTNLDEWQLAAARRQLEEAAQKDVCTIDASLREQVQELTGRLETAETEFNAKHAEADELLHEAEAKLAAFELPAALEAIEKLGSLEVVTWDKALGEKVAALKEQAEATDKDLTSQRETVPKLLADAQANIEAWDLDAARGQIEEAARSKICELDEDLAKHVEQVRAGLKDAQEEVEKRRAQATKLLAEGQRKLAGWDFRGAHETLAKLKELEIVALDEVVGSRVADLDQRISSEEQEFGAQRQAVEALVQQAKASTGELDFEAARQKLEEAAQKDVCKTEADLRKQVSAARSEVSAAEKELKRQQDEAAKLLEDGERKLAALDMTAALEVLAKLDVLDAAQRDEELGPRIVDLTQRTRAAEQELAAQRQTVNGLLERAAAEAVEWEFDTARDCIDQATQQSICKTDGQLRKQVKEAKAGVDAAEKDADKQRDQATELAEDAEQKLDRRDMRAALESLAKLIELDVVMRDEELGAKLAELKQRVEGTQQELTEQRQVVASLVESAKTKMADGDFAGALAQVQEAGEKDICKIDREIHAEIEELRTRLEADAKALQEQQEEVTGLLREAEQKMEASDAGAALEAIGKLEAIEVIGRQKELADKVAALRARAESAEEEFTTQVQSIEEVIRNARTLLAQWDFEKAGKQIERAAGQQACKTDPEVRRRVDGLRSDLDAAQRKANQEREQIEILIQQVESELLAFEFDSARRVIARASSTALYQRDASVRKHVAEVRVKIEEVEKDKQEEERAGKRGTRRGRPAAAAKTTQKDGLPELPKAAAGAGAEAKGPPALPKIPIKAPGKAASPPELPKTSVPAPKAGKAAPPALPTAAKAESSGAKATGRQAPGRAPARAAATPGASGGTGSAAAKRASKSKESWYYYKGGARRGPMPFAGLQKICSEGKLTAKDKVWSSGTRKWVEAGTVPELASCFGSC